MSLHVIQQFFFGGGGGLESLLDLTILEYQK